MNIPQAFYEVLVPLGFSFFVFKSISFLVESFRGTLKEKLSLRDLFLYFLFFPSVLSGPIDRPGVLLKQFGNISDDFGNNIKTGLSFILLGYIKKSVIADRLSFFVDLTYGNIDNSSWLQILIASVFYTFQIYLDFSGYSDMALGFARIFGVSIMQNFE
jgi:D-alanyl-lipoteichoic acid acyltransferase DltB (MBOAT superfamily)